MLPAQRTTGSPWRPVGAVIGTVLAIFLIVVQPWAKSAVSYIGRPLTQAGLWINDHFQIGDDQSRQELEDVREQFLVVVKELAATKLKLEAIESYDVLSSFLGERKLDSVISSVVSFSPDPRIASLVIQSGSENGILSGLAVVSEGVMIGTVARVDKFTSLVRLVTDSQSKVLAKVQNESLSRGILTGEKGLTMNLDFLPQKDEITAGEIVVTSGLDPLIPADIPLGTVERVAARAGELFQQAIIRSPIDYDRIKILAVIKG